MSLLTTRHGLKSVMFDAPLCLPFHYMAEMPVPGIFFGFLRRVVFFFIAVSALINFALLQSPAFALNAGSFDITISGYDNASQQSLMPGENAVFTAGFFCETVCVGIIRGSIRTRAWSAELRPRLVVAVKGYHEVSWLVPIASYALGDATLEVTMTRFLRGKSTGSVDFDINADFSEYTGSEACRECHESNYSSWSRNRHYPLPTCEACHGPGRRHDAADTEEFIFKDTSGKVCAQCHIGDNGTDILAENGFISFYQEHNELKQTGHKKYKHCITCHNPHYNMRQDRNRAIRITCSMCHPGKRIRLHPPSITCEDCHMPKAAVRDASEGKGIYRRGDYATHVMRINSSAAPEDMFDATGTVLQQDSSGPYLTLNFACLSCHDGTHAGKADLQAVRNAAKLIHSP